MPYRIISDEGDRLCIAVSGEIDHHTAAQLRSGIDDEVLRWMPKKLVLDFSGVTFMDSSGIGLIMGRYRLLEPLGGAVELANVPRPLKKVMTVAGITHLAKFTDGGKAHETV